MPAETTTVSRERFELVRAETEELASVMKELRREFKALRLIGKSSAQLEEKVTRVERRYRSARAQLRRLEASDAR